ncbi:N-acetyl-1-D-myo-inositol-2-amino-2-deoxy-alpha-D-glucopyranoside deacetylase [Natronoglycomyces albus]|uniref:1D-myo-inositol 2-acetamido-2-deoxy-alpha-D-glucopyranoside deacetylase n=1 Tax=Natronoglycomyces albus TaxID=2811108 RepID=A0A895XI29_9ACTN|nr:N-acetyl-1-D-myo-inositol-2-amino-2-deoxy-alpha-D-glucopyranoside deacetylase [Natronoglycomyces albus]QSB04607.1 N-acetyl-1-D-myo-inositol-2-amino-2-deoxy-alpha-D-glucopyranoside deacetylase [Natronoglycomyces albus]
MSKPDTTSGTNPQTATDRRSLLFVHAHPDDETVGTGATIAHYVARDDVDVTLVTCTLGEEGEIKTPHLARLEAAQADQLGGYRYAEMAAAADALGLEDWRFLGGAGRWRDSGMMGTPANDHPRAFWGADVDEAAADLVAIVRQIRPEVLVTYDDFGFYGHPDHIQAHRVAMRAAELAEDTDYRPDLGQAHAIRKIYWTTVPKSDLAKSFEEFAGSEDNPFGDITSVDDLPFGVDDDVVTTEIVAEEAAGPKKLAAMSAHATQIAPEDWLYTMAAKLGIESILAEHYILVKGERGPGKGPHNWETDLFA